MMKTHVVILPCPAIGHIRPMMELAKQVATRGFMVTLVLIKEDHLMQPSSTIQEHDEGRGGEGEGEVRIISFPLHVKSGHGSSSVKVLLQAFEDLAPSLSSLLSRLRPSISCIVSDLILSASKEVAISLSVPRIAFVPHMATIYNIYRFLPEDIPSDGLVKDKKMICGIPGIIRPLCTCDLPWLSRMDDESKYFFDFMKRVLKSWEEDGSTKWMLCNSVYELESHAIDALLDQAGITMLPIGPLFLHSHANNNIPLSTPTPTLPTSSAISSSPIDNRKNTMTSTTSTTLNTFSATLSSTIESNKTSNVTSTSPPTSSATSSVANSNSITTIINTNTLPTSISTSSVTIDNNITTNCSTTTLAASSATSSANIDTSNSTSGTTSTTLPTSCSTSSDTIYNNNNNNTTTLPTSSATSHAMIDNKNTATSSTNSTTLSTSSSISSDTIDSSKNTTSSMTSTTLPSYIAPSSATIDSNKNTISSSPSNRVSTTWSVHSDSNIYSRLWTWIEDGSCLQWLDTQEAKSVLFVSFGSITIFQQKQLDEIAFALEGSGRPFLWVVRPDLMDGTHVVLPNGFLNRVHGRRGFVASWAPQVRVLAHPAVGAFLTHCGWNSTLESISMGVPMLAWPYYGDQAMNRSYVTEEWNVGLALDPMSNLDVRMVYRDELKRMINHLMETSERELGQNCQRWKQIATSAIREGCSSSINFNKFVDYLRSLSQH